MPKIYTEFTSINFWRPTLFNHHFIYREIDYFSLHFLYTGNPSDKVNVNNYLNIIYNLMNKEKKFYKPFYINLVKYISHLKQVGKYNINIDEKYIYGIKSINGYQDEFYSIIEFYSIDNFLASSTIKSKYLEYSYLQQANYLPESPKAKISISKIC